MIIGRDTNPTNKIYYKGARLLEILKEFESETINHRELMERSSRDGFTADVLQLTLDWLFLLDLVEADGENIKLCT